MSDTPSLNAETSPVFRHLAPEEIAALERQGCACPRWSGVTVEEPFRPGAYRDVTFSGKVILGSVCEADVEVIAGLPRPRGIYRAVVGDCAIGRDVRVANVPGGLLNLDIGDGVVIDNVDSIVCSGESCFGNDVKVNVMSETGGREVTLGEGLTAPLAYLTAFHRHNALLSKSLEGVAAREADRHRSRRARIGDGAVIINCGEMENVVVGPGARLRGAARLVNGTVGRAYVGTGVTARDFIIQAGAKVDSGARLQGCLVGHCAEVSSGFTAHDTLIFSNSRLENGESAAAFCGPFTTTMHKSTLLIGGLFSFFNAGSGTNQSNHLYKLGPMHQGILARGCKTGSDSYLMWPAAIGAFTTVTGHHCSHPDTRLFPFSYLLEEDGRSTLVPGAAVGSVGLARDVEKWPARVGEEAAADPVNYQWLSPYTAQQLVAAMRQLVKWECEGPRQDGHVEHGGVAIPRSVLEKARLRYILLLDLFAAGVIRRKTLAIAATNPEITPAMLLEKLRERPGADGDGQWMDLCGLLAPRGVIDALSAEIISSPTATVAEINRRLAQINDHYKRLSWSWLWHNLPEVAGSSAESMTIESLGDLLARGARAAVEIERLFVKDAAKEFDPDKAGLGFGIDSGGNRQEMLDDFSRARGNLASQRFLAQLHRRVELFTGSIRNILAMLQAPSEGIDKPVE